MLMFLCLNRSVRFLCFRLESTVLELKLSARYTSCWSEIEVRLVNCVVRVRLDTNPKRKDIPCSVNLLSEMYHAVNIMFTKTLNLLCGILSVRFLVLRRTPICVRM